MAVMYTLRQNVLGGFALNGKKWYACSYSGKHFYGVLDGVVVKDFISDRKISYQSYL